MIETLRIVKENLDENNYYKKSDSINFIGHIVIEADLGIVKFRKMVTASLSIFAEAGSGIKAGDSIEAGWGIKAGDSIEAGLGIEAGSSIEAGDGIKAGWGIITLLGGIRATTITCLRISAGFHTKTKQFIEAKVTGEIILGEETNPNPLKVEYYWHIHHDKLVEALTETVENRISYIKSDKPKHEIETRLRLLKPVKNIERLKTIFKIRDPKEQKITLEDLHKKECPGCPWNGHTIFPRKRCE